MSEEIKHNRRRFLGTAAMTFAAAQPEHLQQVQSLKTHSLDPTELVLNIIPSSFFNAFGETPRHESSC